MITTRSAAERNRVSSGRIIAPFTSVLFLAVWLIASGLLNMTRCLAEEAVVTVKEEVSLGSMEGVKEVNIVSLYEFEGDPMDVVSPILRGKPLISRLTGTSVVMALTNSQPLRYLAIPRIGWDDWAVPNEVAVSVNGTDYGAFRLSAPIIHPASRVAPVTVDIIDLGREVPATRIEIEILAASPTKGQNKHGTLRVLLPSPQ